MSYCARCKLPGNDHFSTCPLYAGNNAAEDDPATASAEHAWFAIPGCMCETCVPMGLPGSPTYRFIACQTCGNKRCPHAANHRNACTNSNESGQPGSNFPAAPPEPPPSAERCITNPKLCKTPLTCGAVGCKREREENHARPGQKMEVATPLVVAAPAPTPAPTVGPSDAEFPAPNDGELDMMMDSILHGIGASSTMSATTRYSMRAVMRDGYKWGYGNSAARLTALSQSLETAERERERQRQQVDALTYVDEAGTSWTAPTGWAYMMACKVRDEARADAHRFDQIAATAQVNVTDKYVYWKLGNIRGELGTTLRQAIDAAQQTAKEQK